MRRLDFLMVAVLLSFCVPHAAAQTAPAYRVEWRMNLPADLPPGAPILCKAKLVPGTGGMPAGGFAPVATGAGERNGSSARCAVEVPVWWHAHPGDRGAKLSAEVDALEPVGGGQRVVRLAGEKDLPLAAEPRSESGELHVTLLH